MQSAFPVSVLDYTSGQKSFTHGWPTNGVHFRPLVPLYQYRVLLLSS
jgi:hypothetical protein